MNSRVNAYVLAVVAVAIAIVAGLAAYAPGIDRGLVAGAAAFALMGLVAQALTFAMATGSIGSISFLPFLTCIVLYPSWVSVCMIGLAMLLGELRQKKPNIKRAFNVAQYVAA